MKPQFSAFSKEEIFLLVTRPTHVKMCKSGFTDSKGNFAIFLLDRIRNNVALFLFEKLGATSPNAQGYNQSNIA